MKVMIFGATGMVGQGVLLESLRDPRVERVLVVGRSAIERAALERRLSPSELGKLSEIVHQNLLDPTAVEAEFAGYDACFFCLGISSAGLDEAAYRRTTYDLTLAVVSAVARQSPNIVLTYVSGAGTDSTEKGNTMWARVKGQTENALLRLPIKDAYMFRPGYIHPMDGATSKTAWVRALLPVVSPLYHLFKHLIPDQLTTTTNVGRAMLRVASEGSDEKILYAKAINALAKS